MTYQKCKGDNQPLLGNNDEDDDTNGGFISVYQQEVGS